MSALLIGEIEYGTPRAARIMNEFWANPVKGIMLQRRASLAVNFFWSFSRCPLLCCSLARNTSVEHHTAVSSSTNETGEYIYTPHAA